MPPKLLFQLEQLTKLMAPAGEFAEYHKEIRSLKAPYVPYLGAELQAFATIDQSNPSLIEQSTGVLLNFEKAKKMLDAMKKLNAYKAKSYSLNNSNKGEVIGYFSVTYSFHRGCTLSRNCGGVGAERAHPNRHPSRGDR